MYVLSTYENPTRIKQVGFSTLATFKKSEEWRIFIDYTNSPNMAITFSCMA
jgi:hypothetical protein